MTACPFSVFISHFTGERVLAEKLQNLLKAAFANQLSTLRSSGAESISTGEGQYHRNRHTGRGSPFLDEFRSAERELPNVRLELEPYLSDDRSIPPLLIATEARRAERELHPGSMDMYFQGAAWLNKGPSPENLAQARRCFERALALDSDNLEALIGIASIDAQRGAWFLADDRSARLAAAESALSKVLSLAPNHAVAHYLLGVVQVYSNRAAQGIAQCEQALGLDRNLAVAHGLIGAAKYFSGQGEETEAHTREALRLSPRDTNAWPWLAWVGNAKTQLGAGGGGHRLVSSWN
jgi:tetratricopeptide (TPR) repeat protein